MQNLHVKSLHYLFLLVYLRRGLKRAVLRLGRLLEVVTWTGVEIIPKVGGGAAKILKTTHPPQIANEVGINDINMQIRRFLENEHFVDVYLRHAESAFRCRVVSLKGELERGVGVFGAFGEGEVNDSELFGGEIYVTAGSLPLRWRLVFGRVVEVG